ncbi:hypothetical protein HK405_006118, partial [Cladochytrium tenue]
MGGEAASPLVWIRGCDDHTVKVSLHVGYAVEKRADILLAEQQQLQQHQQQQQQKGERPPGPAAKHQKAATGAAAAAAATRVRAKKESEFRSFFITYGTGSSPGDACASSSSNGVNNSSNSTGTATAGQLVPDGRSPPLPADATRWAATHDAVVDAAFLVAALRGGGAALHVAFYENVRVETRVPIDPDRSGSRARGINLADNGLPRRELTRRSSAAARGTSSAPVQPAAAVAGALAGGDSGGEVAAGADPTGGTPRVSGELVGGGGDSDGAGADTSRRDDGTPGSRSVPQAAVKEGVHPHHYATSRPHSAESSRGGGGGGRSQRRSEATSGATTRTASPVADPAGRDAGAHRSEGHNPPPASGRHDRHSRQHSQPRQATHRRPHHHSGESASQPAQLEDGVGADSGSGSSVERSDEHVRTSQGQQMQRAGSRHVAFRGLRGPRSTGDLVGATADGWRGPTSVAVQSSEVELTMLQRALLDPETVRSRRPRSSGGGSVTAVEHGGDRRRPRRSTSKEREGAPKTRTVVEIHKRLVGTAVLDLTDLFLGSLSVAT